MKKYNKGFTLIELMAVLVILGILATIVVVNVSPVFQRANLEKVRADMAQTTKALELYKFNEMTYPNTSQGLDALITPHSELKNPFLFPDGGYISSIVSNFKPIISLSCFKLSTSTVIFLPFLFLIAADTKVLISELAM